MTGSFPRVPPGVSETFWRLVLAEPLAGIEVVDVATGTGRLALALAPLAARVVGVDRDAGQIGEARGRAAAAGLRNVDFAVVDVERVGDFRDLGPGLHVDPQLVVAHLYLSSALVENASRSLPEGGALAVVGFHADQWRETGRRSRFAYDEEEARRLLDDSGFAVEHLEIEREVRTFVSVEDGLSATTGLEEKWKADGRWARWLDFLAAGGRTLTQSHLVVKARRR